MAKYLVVCFGNTCRSPMFAAVLERSFKKHGRGDLEVESVGLNRESAGQPAAAEWEQLRELTGVDLSGHKSRCIDDLSWRELNQYDTVFCLDKKVHDELVGNRKWSAGRVKLLDIPNPWQQGVDAYRACYVTIEQLVETI